MNKLNDALLKTERITQDELDKLVDECVNELKYEIVHKSNYDIDSLSLVIRSYFNSKSLQCILNYIYQEDKGGHYGF